MNKIPDNVIDAFSWAEIEPSQSLARSERGNWVCALQDESRDSGLRRDKPNSVKGWFRNLRNAILKMNKIPDKVIDAFSWAEIEPSQSSARSERDNSVCAPQAEIAGSLGQTKFCEGVISESAKCNIKDE